LELVDPGGVDEGGFPKEHLHFFSESRHGRTDRQDALHTEVIEGESQWFCFDKQAAYPLFEWSSEASTGLSCPPAFGEDVDPLTVLQSVEKEAESGLVESASADDRNTLPGAKEESLEIGAKEVDVVGGNPADFGIAGLS
jgi:hypothetical protein